MSSRRRVSVKELGQADHQGWLYRKKEGKGFLSIKWKKYWFVLKKTSLYWYTNEGAEKAEGYINLKDFMIDRALECKKKFAFKACHPTVRMFYFAAESNEEMNRWLNKLGLASIEYEPTEGHAAGEIFGLFTTKRVLHIFVPLLTLSMLRGTLPPPYSSAPPSEATGSLSSPVSTMTSHGSVSFLSKHPCADDIADEMERLYVHLKEASLSPIGERKPSTKKEFRASFIKRCKNPKINEKLHLIRTLNSTLKAKEADLHKLDEVLSDVTLSASKFREWKEANATLLQDVCLHHNKPVETQDPSAGEPAEEAATPDSARDVSTERRA
uniref:PH domain-containing protein n=1 Tax=Denticeps clupeoides TaxID=299321 RepID=A0AAY4CLK6_9TELE